MRALLKTYLRLLETKPLITMSVTTGIKLCSCGIALKQMGKGGEHKKVWTYEEIKKIKKDLLKRPAFTYGALMSIGDAIAQLAIERRGFDLHRNARFLSFGLFIGGPMFRVWYLRLDKVFGKTKYANLKMVFADQGLFAPVFLPFFLGTMGVMRQDPLPLVVEKVKNDYWSVMTSNWTIWPLAQLINFTFVPLQHRVMVVNLVSVGWNTYLAWKSEGEHESIVHELEEEEEHRHSAEQSQRSPAGQGEPIGGKSSACSGSSSSDPSNRLNLQVNKKVSVIE